MTTPMTKHKDISCYPLGLDLQEQMGTGSSLLQLSECPLTPGSIRLTSPCNLCQLLISLVPHNACKIVVLPHSTSSLNCLLQSPTPDLPSVWLCLSWTLGGTQIARMADFILMSWNIKKGSSFINNNFCFLHLHIWIYDSPQRLKTY